MLQIATDIDANIDSFIDLFSLLPTFAGNVCLVFCFFPTTSILARRLVRCVCAWVAVPCTSRSSPDKRDLSNRRKGDGMHTSVDVNFACFPLKVAADAAAAEATPILLFIPPISSADDK